MTARIALSVLLLLLAACPDMPDAQSITDDCREVVAGELDQVRADTWALCSSAYEGIIDQLEQTQTAMVEACDKAARDAAVGGCEQYIVGWMADYLHGQRCTYDHGWRCEDGPLCQRAVP